MWSTDVFIEESEKLKKTKSSIYSSNLYKMNPYEDIEYKNIDIPELKLSSITFNILCHPILPHIFIGNINGELLYYRYITLKEFHNSKNLNLLKHKLIWSKNTYHTNNIRSLSFMKDCNYKILISADNKGIINIIHIDNGTLLYTFTLENTSICKVISFQYNSIIISDEEGQLIRYKLHGYSKNQQLEQEYTIKNHTLIWKIQEAGDYISDLCIIKHKNLNLLLVTSGDGFFDFVEGITVLSQNGQIIFPNAEPFG